MITLKCCVKFLLLARQDLRTKAQDVLVRSRCAAFSSISGCYRSQGFITSQAQA